MPGFISSKITKARKPHKCCICNKTIAKGDEYERNTNRQDGEIYSLTTCMECFAFIKENCYFCKDRSDCFEDISGIYECMEERKAK